jgi:hypothetical protein
MDVQVGGSFRERSVWRRKDGSFVPFILGLWIWGIRSDISRPMRLKDVVCHFKSRKPPTNMELSRYSISKPWGDTKHTILFHFSCTPWPEVRLLHPAFRA